MIRNFDELLELVRSQPRKTVAIAAAHTPTAIDAAIMAYRENLGDALLVGDAAFINDYLKTNAADLAEAFTIIDTGHDLAAAAAASVQAVRDGKADLILKGKCDSGTLLRAVLHKEKGLRTGNVMSDVLAYETPDRVILMGDGGFCHCQTSRRKSQL